MTQCEKVLMHMKLHGSITPMDAFSNYGIMRLGARIFDLKNMGHDIRMEMEEGHNRYGEAVRFARYRLHDADRYSLQEAAQCRMTQS